MIGFVVSYLHTINYHKLFRVLLIFCILRTLLLETRDKLNIFVLLYLKNLS